MLHLICGVCVDTWGKAWEATDETDTFGTRQACVCFSTARDGQGSETDAAVAWCVRCGVLQGPPLQLRESWQVEVVGSKVVRAGLLGAVKWAAPEAKALAGSTPFRLQVGSSSRGNRAWDSLWRTVWGWCCEVRWRCRGATQASTLWKPCAVLGAAHKHAAGIWLGCCHTHQPAKQCVCGHVFVCV